MLGQVELPWRKLQPEVLDHFKAHGIEFDEVHLYKDIFDANGDINVKEVIYKWIEKDLEQHMKAGDEVLNWLVNHKKKLFLITQEEHTDL